MRFRLWEKSFLLTFAVFFVLLNAGLGIWSVMNFKSEYSKYKQQCENEAQNIYISAQKVCDEEITNTEFRRLCSMHSKNGTYIKAENYNGMIFNNLSAKLPELYLIGMTEIYDDIYDYGMYYYSNYDVKYMDSQRGLRFIYAKDMSEFCRQQRGYLIWTGAVDVLLGVAVGLLLYMTMKKIYRPVNNISHELRTPLTSIQGYAQYLSGFDLTPEDRVFAQQQIINEAQYMNDIIDRLLTIEGIKNSRVKKEKVDFTQLLDEIKLGFPDVEIENSIEYVNCDRVLFKSMLMNIVGNAVREGGNVKLTGSYSLIKVTNENNSLSAEDIKMLNKGGLLSVSRIKGHGYGIELCREIAKAHRWSLKYEEEDGQLAAKIIM